MMNQFLFLSFDAESMMLAFSVKFHFSLDKHIGHKQGSGDDLLFSWKFSGREPLEKLRITSFMLAGVF